jgi:hypothetical protein
MSKTKHKPSREQLSYLLFENEMHRLLDLLGAPPGRFIALRLETYLQKQGINTEKK